VYLLAGLPDPTFLTTLSRDTAHEHGLGVPDLPAEVESIKLIDLKGCSLLALLNRGTEKHYVPLRKGTVDLLPSEIRIIQNP